MEENLVSFLHHHVGSVDHITPLHGDASNRRYSRVLTGTASWILCQDTPWKGISDTEAVNTLFNNHHIPVPALTATEPAAGLLLLEDGGDIHLEEAVTADTEPGAHNAAKGIYRQLIDIMVRIQAIQGRGRCPFTRRFDRDKLNFEFEFFIQHALEGYFHAALTHSAMTGLRSAFMSIAGQLDRPDDFVLNHRDYHSRNVLVNGEQVLLIDYQDAMLGLPLYDAVSLLRDSRVVLDDQTVAELKEQHRVQLSDTGGFRKLSEDEYEHWFKWMAFQRNIKALGTFGYQVSIGNASFENNIPPILHYLPSYTEGEPELNKTYALLKPYMRRI